MATLLITGGAGFIGSNLVQYALDHSSDRIVILDKLTYAGSLRSLDGPLKNPRVTFVRGDIADAGAVATVFADAQPTAILNLAAETHVDRSIDSPRVFIDTNIVGTFVLLEAARAYAGGLAPAAREAFRFLHVSTDEVYGTLGVSGLFSEETPYAPNSPYAASKAAADHLVRASFHTYGLPTLITNCSNNYGPFQFPEKLIPLMLLNALEGRLLPIYGDGGNVRDWLHVEDHCAGIMLVLAKGRLGEQVQRRRRQRAHESRDRRSHLRRGGGAPAGDVEPGAAGARLSRSEDVRPRSSRPRSPVRDRRVEDPPRARLGAAPLLRGRARVDRALVRRSPRLVQTGPGRVRSGAARNSELETQNLKLRT